MATDQKCSTDSSLNSKKGKKENRRLNMHTMYAHRDTGVSPITAAPLPLRVTRDYFSNNYGDVIEHCRKLSSDE